MIKKLIGIIRIIIIKIKYLGKFKILGKIYNNYISQFSNINIIDGKIKIDDKIYMKKGSRIGVNKGGKIHIKSCYMNNIVLCISMGNIQIGKNVSIGPNTVIYDHDHAFNENGKIDNEYKIGSVVIEDNVWIGAGVIILRNTTIGKNCLIGAGTIVKGNIPNNTIVTTNREINIKKLVKK